MVFYKNNTDMQPDLTKARAAILAHLPADLILNCYQNAGGDEILSGKFASSESSAALAANTFGFFLENPRRFSLLRPPIEAGTVQEVRIECELRFPWTGGTHPWLDAVVSTERALVGIESK